MILKCGSERRNRGEQGDDEGRSCRNLKAMNTAKVRFASLRRNLTVGFNDRET